MKLTQAALAILLVVFGLIVYNVTARAQRSSQTPDIISGGDLGFRVSGFDKSGRVQGEIVVRVDGVWTSTDEDHHVRVIPAR